MLNSFYFPTKPTPPERLFPPHFQSTFPISLRWMCDWMSWTEKNYIKLCAMKALSTWSGVESWDGKTLCCRHGESRDRTRTYNENKFFSFLKQKKLINIKTNCSFFSHNVAVRPRLRLQYLSTRLDSTLFHIFHSDCIKKIPPNWTQSTEEEWIAKII